MNNPAASSGVSPEEILLTPQAALDILAKRYKNRKLIRWVFPGGKYGSSANHISEPKDSWKKITEKAGTTDLHIHDLRRTLASLYLLQVEFPIGRS